MSDMPSWRFMSKTPFPWFGGKTDASEAVWDALGDVDHYVEPFFGGGAVLLNRPHQCNRTYHSETVNDIDGLLVNAWRGIQMYPDETAEAASWPISEADMHARHLSLCHWRATHELEHLMGDPTWCDPRMAGWWLWGICCWIGGHWCSGRGAWVVAPDGRIVRRGDVEDSDGEEGVDRRRPHLVGNGQGVNTPAMREEGVDRARPFLGNNGRGVNHGSLREEGVTRKKPFLSNNGQGVNHANLREEGVDGDEYYHPMTMPKLRIWFGWLSARLRHVRICNGDWSRVVTGSASKTLPVRMGGGVCGVFLDPPYADTAERTDLYTHDDMQIAHAVRKWAIEHGDDPDYRIVMAGYEGEHGDEFKEAGWPEVEWFKRGLLKGGMAQIGKDRQHQQHRERLWMSPHCLAKTVERQATLF